MSNENKYEIRVMTIDDYDEGVQPLADHPRLWNPFY